MRPVLAILGFVCACGGEPFNTSVGAAEAGGERLDLPDVFDAAPADVGAARGDSEGDSSPPPTCDLAPCRAFGCTGLYNPLCCEGACPAGAQGTTCYCGECRGTHYDPDGGACR